MWQLSFVIGICSSLWLGAAYSQSNIIGSGVYGDTKGGSVPFSLTYGGSGTSTNIISTTQSYGTITWGSGCSALVNGILWYQTVTIGSTIASKSDNSVAASQISGAIAQGANLAAGDIAADAWEVTAPSGTSGAVSVTYSTPPSYNQSVAVYCLVSSHPTAGTPATVVQGTASSSISTSVTVPSGGAALVMVQTYSGQAFTLSGATVDVTITTGGVQQVFAHTTATGSVTVTATSTGGTATWVMSLVPFGP